MSRRSSQTKNLSSDDLKQRALDCCAQLRKVCCDINDESLYLDVSVMLAWLISTLLWVLYTMQSLQYPDYLQFNCGNTVRDAMLCLPQLSPSQKEALVERLVEVHTVARNA